MRKHRVLVTTFATHFALGVIGVAQAWAQNGVIIDVPATLNQRRRHHFLVTILAVLFSWGLLAASPVVAQTVAIIPNFSSPCRAVELTDFPFPLSTLATQGWRSSLILILRDQLP